MSKKALALVIIAVILLAGCRNPVKEARAARIRESTRQTKQLHDQRMADNRALAQTRVTAKETFLYAGMFGGIVLIAVTVTAWSYYIVGSTRAAVTKKQILLVNDPQGRRFPVLIKDDFVMNLSTGERFLIGQTNEPNPLLVDSSTKIQLGRRQQIDKIIEGRLLAQSND